MLNLQAAYSYGGGFEAQGTILDTPKIMLRNSLQRLMRLQTNPT